MLKTIAVGAVLVTCGTVVSGLTNSSIGEYIRTTFNHVCRVLRQDILHTRKVSISADSKILEMIIDEKVICLNKNIEPIITDTPSGLKKNVSNGVYVIGQIKDTTVYAIKTESGYSVSTYNNENITENCLIAFIDTIYQNKFSPSICIMHYTIDNRQWKFCKSAELIDFRKLHMNNQLENIICSVNEWYYGVRSKSFHFNGRPQSEKAYGILLHGATGSGKTKCIEIIASMLKMRCYHVSLNNNNLDDASLQTLIAQISVPSVVVFDELDKKIETMQTNRLVNVSIGGILEALDGAIRMNKNCITVITSTNVNKLFEQFSEEELTRNGRISGVFELTETIN